MGPCDPGPHIDNPINHATHATESTLDVRESLSKGTVRILEDGTTICTLSNIDIPITMDGHGNRFWASFGTS